MELLFSIDEMLPTKPVVIKTDISEGLPGKGIAFTDKRNQKRYFYIVGNGIDDSLTLMEFENKSIDSYKQNIQPME